MTVYDMSGDPKTWQPGVMTPTYFGCPWHGVMKNGTLYENDATTIKKSIPAWQQLASATYPGIFSSTQLVRVPGMPAISRTTAQQTWDAAQKFDWKNYALVGGYHLYGKALHSNWIIYIDGNNQPWMLDMTLSAGGAGFFATVYLRRIFGRITESSYPVINATLATYSDVTMATESGAVYIYSGPQSIERNSTGSVVFINVYAYKTRPTPSVTNLGLLDGGNDQFNSYKPKLGKLLAVYKVEITGNGSIVPASLGDGISATVSLYKDYAACYSTASVLNGQSFGPFVSVGGIDTDTTIDNDPRVTPPCPATYEDITTNVPHVYPINYSDHYEAVETRLLRVLFDDDVEVEYSAKYINSPNRTETTVSLGGNTVDKVIHEVVFNPDSGGYCEIVGFTEEHTGTITRQINQTIINYKKIALFRNGVEVASGDVTETSVYARSDTQSIAGYSESVTQDTTTVTCNGQVLPYTYNYYLIVHPYSPQIYGVQLRDTSQSPPPAYCRMEAVMVPWGADSTHEHTDLTHSGFQCIGSHEPIEQLAYWYEAGVSDAANAKINFV